MTNQELALQIFCSDSFLTLNKKLLITFGPDVAVFIANLIDKFKYFQSKGKLEDDESFFLTYETQEAQTGMSKYQLRACKQKLIALGILKTYKKGIPPKEFYQINFQNLNKNCLIDIGKETLPMTVKKLNQLPERNLTNIKDTKSNNTKSKGKDISPEVFSSDEFKTKRHIPEEKKTIYRKLSLRLKEILTAAKKLQSGARTADWPDYFRKLEKTFSISEIKSTLDWYEEHMGEEYVPVCYSAASFHDKFINLQDAIERESGSKKKTPAKPKTRSNGSEVIKNKYDQFESWILDNETGEKFLKGSPEHKEWLKTKEKQK